MFPIFLSRTPWVRTNHQSLPFFVPGVVHRRATQHDQTALVQTALVAETDRRRRKHGGKNPSPASSAVVSVPRKALSIADNNYALREGWGNALHGAPQVMCAKPAWKITLKTISCKRIQETLAVLFTHHNKGAANAPNLVSVYHGLFLVLRVRESRSASAITRIRLAPSSMSKKALSNFRPSEASPESANSCRRKILAMRDRLGSPFQRPSLFEEQSIMIA